MQTSATGVFAAVSAARAKTVIEQSAALPIRRDEWARIGKEQFELGQEVFVGQRRTADIVSLSWHRRQNVRKKDSHFAEQVDERRLGL